MIYLLGCGEVGAVGAGGAVFGSRAAGDVVGVRQGPPLHLCQHTLPVQQRLEEACVAVELHQVEDLKGREKRKDTISGQQKIQIWNEKTNRKGKIRKKSLRATEFQKLRTKIKDYE